MKNIEQKTVCMHAPPQSFGEGSLTILEHLPGLSEQIDAIRAKYTRQAESGGGLAEFLAQNRAVGGKEALSLLFVLLWIICDVGQNSKFTKTGSGQTHKEA